MCGALPPTFWAPWAPPPGPLLGRDVREGKTDLMDLWPLSYYTIYFENYTFTRGGDGGER